MFSWTQVPRILLYEERTYMYDFIHDDESSIDYHLYNNLLRLPFMQRLSNLPEMVLRIFNNAYYICTLIRKEYTPRHFFSEYREIASENNTAELWRNQVMPATFAIVYCLLRYYDYECYKDFLKDIWIYFQDENNYVIDESSNIFKSVVVNLCMSDDKNTFDVFEERFLYDAINDKSLTILDLAKGMGYITMEMNARGDMWESEECRQFFPAFLDKLNAALPNYSRDLDALKELNNAIECVKSYMKEFETTPILPVNKKFANSKLAEILAAERDSIETTEEPQLSKQKKYPSIKQVFHDKLDEDTIINAIIKLPRYDIEGEEDFFYVLYAVFNELKWLSYKNQNNFTRWLKSKNLCHLSNDGFKKAKKSGNPIFDNAFPNVLSHFSSKISDVVYNDKDDFYKKDACGKILKKINDASL